jgi:phosphatidylglycerophosphatase C
VSEPERQSEPERPGERQGVAAFDFDGTMIRGDSFMPFLIKAVGPRQFGRVVIASSPSTAQAYRSGRRDASKAVLVRRLLSGYPADRLAELGRSYSTLLAGRIRPVMAARVAWHRDQGHRLVMVSASLDVYLAPTGAALGFDQVLATELEVDERGLLTGKLLGANVRGVEKAARLRAWLARALPDTPYRLWAYGDSAGDRELLAMADHPVRV